MPLARLSLSRNAFWAGQLVMEAKARQEVGKSDLIYQEEKRRHCLAALVAINLSKKMRPSEVHIHPVFVPLNEAAVRRLAYTRSYRSFRGRLQGTYL